MENRQGEGKNSVGNVEAKELIIMIHGHELQGGECGREGAGRMEWSEGGKWDNCNSIINKHIKKKERAFFLIATEVSGSIPVGSAPAMCPLLRQPEWPG